MTFACLIWAAEPPELPDSSGGLSAIVGSLLTLLVVGFGIWLARRGCAERNAVMLALKRDTISEPLTSYRQSWLALLPADGTAISTASREAYERTQLGALHSRFVLALIFAPLALALGLLITLFDFTGALRASVAPIPLLVSVIAGVVLVAWVTKLRLDHEQTLRDLLNWLFVQAEQERITRLMKLHQSQDKIQELTRALALAERERDEAKAHISRVTAMNMAPAHELPDNPVGPSRRGADSQAKPDWPMNQQAPPTQTFEPPAQPQGGGGPIDLP